MGFYEEKWRLMGLFFIIGKSFVLKSSSSHKPSLCLILCVEFGIFPSTLQKKCCFFFVCLSFFSVCFVCFLFLSDFPILHSCLLFHIIFFNIARPDSPSSQESWAEH